MEFKCKYTDPHLTLDSWIHLLECDDRIQDSISEWLLGQ